MRILRDFVTNYHDSEIDSIVQPDFARRLVGNVAECIDHHDLYEKIVIHLASDHGSTRIPESLSNDIDMKYFQDSDFRPVSHRVVPVTSERFSRLPDNLKEDCFFLDRGRFGNEQHYLCARRSNRFLATTAKHYVHGGLSPEEIIVPYLVFQEITTPIEPLTLLLQKDTLRYRLETITFELGNPNEYRVEQIEIQILNSNVQAEPYHIDGLDAKTQTTCSLQGRFTKTQNQDEQNFLRFSMTFTCHGERQRKEITCPITMKAMVTLKDETIFDEF